MLATFLDNSKMLQTKIFRSSSDHKVEIVVKRYQDSVYEFYFPNEMLLVSSIHLQMHNFSILRKLPFFLSYSKVRTDGHHIEISAPQISHGNSVGLCGNYDGEAVGDLKTSKQVNNSNCVIYL